MWISDLEYSRNSKKEKEKEKKKLQKMNSK